MKKVYLDTNATTKPYPEVVEEMLPFFKEAYGNASSIYGFGRTAKKGLETARERVRKLIGAEFADEIVFTSGGTESDNCAIKQILRTSTNKGKHIITTCVEHKAVLNTCRYLEESGVRVTYLNVDEYGRINLEELEKSIAADTVLISVMSANNETGTLMPIEEVGIIAKKNNILFHTDAVQLIGKMPFDVKKSGADLVSISAHKINGPKGVGALFVKRGTPLTPYFHGGYQERGLRAGTENVPGIVGFGKACEMTASRLDENREKIGALKKLLYEGIKRSIKDIKLNGDPEKCLPNTLNVSFAYIEGEAIVLNLDAEGIAVSTGSACTSGSSDPSYVLKNMKVGPLFIQGAIRFSLGVFTSREDIDCVIEKLPRIIEKLRNISPVN
ncbi:MAG: cysteine desulfurase NifS [Candidatus Omnitrophica bacterium]|nr:cysteine desulfurase NifS [Candidatus Omnitrophota bacterium]